MAATFHAASTTSWTPVVDGAAYSRVGIQHNGRRLEIYSGATVPGEQTQDFVVVSPDTSHEVVIGLLATEKVYVRTRETMTVGVRGFLEVRT